MPANLSKFIADVGQFGFQKPSWFEFRLGRQPAGFTKQNTTAWSQEELKLYESVDVGVDFYSWAAQGLVCSSVNLPGRGFATADQSIYGFERKVPYFNTYNSLQCTFVSPFNKQGKNIGYDFFQKWQNLISNTRISSPNSTLSSGAFDMEFPANYYTDAELWLFSFIDNQDTYKYTGGSGQAGLQSNSFKQVELGGLLGTQEFRQVSLRHRYTDLYPVSVEASQLNWADTDSFAQITVTFNYSYWVDMGISDEPTDNIFTYPDLLEARTFPNIAPATTKSKTQQFFEQLSRAAYNTAVFNGWIK